MKETRWDKAITYREVAREESDWMTKFTTERLQDLFEDEPICRLDRYSKSYREDGVQISVDFIGGYEAANVSLAQKRFFAKFKYWIKKGELTPIQFDSQFRDFRFKYSYDEVENISEEIIIILEDREVEVGEVRFQEHSEYQPLEYDECIDVSGFSKE